MSTNVNIYCRWFLCAVLIVLALWFLAVCEATAIAEGGEAAAAAVQEQRGQRRAGRNLGLDRRIGASSPQMMNR